MKLFKQILYLVIFILINLKSFATSHNTNSTIEVEEGNDGLFKTENEELKNIQILLDQRKLKLALEKLHLFLDKVEKEKNTKLIIEGNILLADVLRGNGDFKTSNEIFNSVLPLITNDFEKLQYVFFKKGGNFQGDHQIDSAKINYEKSIGCSNKVGGNGELKAKVYANLSGIFYLKGDYDKAIENYKIAANIQNTLGNIEIESGILNNMGNVYCMQGKFNQALEFYQKSYDLVGYGQEDYQRLVRSRAYINKAYAYSGLKNYKKAYELQDQYFSLSDSLQKDLKYKEITEIEAKYDVAAKERETEIEKEKRKDVEMVTYGLGIAVFILLLAIYVIYKLLKLNKINHALEINQEQLLNQNRIEKIKSESQSKILAATLDGRIGERKKISAVLHDNVSALLSAANLHLYAAKKQLKEVVPVELDKTQSIISDASEQIRTLSHKLISSVLLKFGLSVATQDICEKSSNSTITINCDSKNIGRFNQDFEIKLFNIINELVNNILKHSKAKNATVKLEQLNGKLQVLVFDNGTGFNVNMENAESGIGLSQVKARIDVLEGIIDIKSSITGTRIYISVPIVY